MLHANLKSHGGSKFSTNLRSSWTLSEHGCLCIFGVKHDEMSPGEAGRPCAIFLKEGLPNDCIFESMLNRAQPIPGMSLKHFFLLLCELISSGATLYLPPLQIFKICLPYFCHQFGHRLSAPTMRQPEQHPVWKS